MDVALFDPSVLPAPSLLRRRHLALVLLDECLGGREPAGYGLHSSTAGDELLWYANGSGDEYGLVLDADDALLWAAQALVALVAHGDPVSEEALEALAPPDGTPAMVARARELGLAAGPT